MIQKLQNNQKGFTLIELMIVIAIIGILSAIAIPNFLSYRQKGYDATAKSDAKNFYSACAANATGSTSATWDETHNPTGFDPVTPVTGTLEYDGTNGTFTSSLSFKHLSGTKTYSVSSTGVITES